MDLVLVLSCSATLYQHITRSSFLYYEGTFLTKMTKKPLITVNRPVRDQPHSFCRYYILQILSHCQLQRKLRISESKNSRALRIAWQEWIAFMTNSKYQNTFCGIENSPGPCWNTCSLLVGPQISPQALSQPSTGEIANCSWNVMFTRHDMIFTSSHEGWFYFKGWQIIFLPTWYFL